MDEVSQFERRHPEMYECPECYGSRYAWGRDRDGAIVPYAYCDECKGTGEISRAEFVTREILRSS